MSIRMPVKLFLSDREMSWHCRNASETPSPVSSTNSFRLDGLMFRSLLIVACSLTFASSALEARTMKRPTGVAAVSHGHAAAALISAYRAQHGLGPVILDPRLTQAAAYQAKANASAGTLSHDVGGSFQNRMARAGIRGGYKAENLGAGSLSVDQVFAVWRSSPQHNSNMLQPGFRRIGIAYADAPGSAYSRFWALELAQ